MSVEVIKNGYKLTESIDKKLIVLLEKDTEENKLEGERLKEIKNNIEELQQVMLSDFLGHGAAKGMCTEVQAKMIINPNNDHQRGFNDALKWVVRLVKRYEKGEGLFQL